MRDGRWRRRLGATGYLLALVLFPDPGATQEFEALVSACGGLNGPLLERCHQGALALEATRATLALAAAGGSEVPGSGSTLGFRLRTFPRVAFGLGAGVARGKAPDITRGYDPGLTPESFWVPSLSLRASVGLFDGFSPLPALGGILALDLTGSLQKSFPPKDRGFQDHPMGWGFGGRLGILRESFTLPGVSLSLLHRSLGEVGVGVLDRGDPAELRMDGQVTSLRGIVGKDLLGLGLLAGVGWDRIEGDGELGVRVSPTGVEASASAKGLVSERLTYFAGGSLTFLILQLSAEGGWSGARNPPLPDRPGGSGDPELGVSYVSVALRITF